MKPAKIGQLTPISYRSRPIDRPDPAGAGVHVLPTAQRAWLCGRDSGVADVYGDVDQEEEVDGPVIATKSNVNAVSSCRTATATTSATTPTAAATAAFRPETTHWATVLTPCPRDSELRGGNRVCYNNGATNGSQFSGLRSEPGDVEEQNIDKGSSTKDEHESSDASSSNTGRTFVDAESTPSKVDDLILLHVTDPLCDETCICLNQPPYNVDHDCDAVSKVCSPNIPKSIQASSTYETVSEETLCCMCSAHKERFDGEHSQTDLATDHLTVAVTDMNAKESRQPVAYANFLNEGNSVSSCDEVDKLVCLCTANKQEQILAVNPHDFHQNRLSHQYLNSSVTGQNYPDILPESGQTYRYVFTDTGLVACPEFQFHSDMIFTAANTKETSFIEKSNNCRSDIPSSPGHHHYYNKNSVFTPLVSEDCASPATGCRQCSDKSFKNFLPANGHSQHENRRESDLDLMLFPQRSQFNCPLHRSPLLVPPHRPLQSQPQYSLHQHLEQQQLLNQLNSQNHQYRHHQQNRPHRSDTSGGSYLMHHIKCGPHHFRISPVSLLWTFLSVLVAGTCLLSFMTPYWTIHPDHVHSFGLFNLCIRDQRFSHPRPLCTNFGNQNYYSSSRFSTADTSNNISTEAVQIDTGPVDIARIPSGAWQAACLLYGAGVCIQILGALVSLAVLALNEPRHHRVALINGYMQTVGGK